MLKAHNPASTFSNGSFPIVLVLVLVLEFFLFLFPLPSPPPLRPPVSCRRKVLRMSACPCAWNCRSTHLSLTPNFSWAFPQFDPPLLGERDRVRADRNTYRLF